MFKVLCFLIGFFSVAEFQIIFRPNLPAGEYYPVFDKIYPCKSIRNHSVQFNFYFSKKTSSITELKGNMTFLVPFDDTLTIDINLASWSLTGGWTPNAFVYATKNACSNAKKFLGNLWFAFVRAFNIPTASCPIPAGTYISSGLDTKLSEDHGFPKVYFYGKYKATCKVKNKENKELGGFISEMNLVRPWEKPV